MNCIQPTIILNNGVEMPRVGLGVWKVPDGDTVIRAVKHAIDVGYRSIDTAKVYENEIGVGKAIEQCGVSRKELFITTKLWNSDQGYDNTLRALDASLDRLGIEYLDLYLIHWPVPGKFKQSWKAIEQAYKDGRIRAIGVSNFLQRNLDDLLEDASVTPAVNQFELHPLLNQTELRDYCKNLGIVVEAWSPLAQGTLFEHPVLKKIAETYGKSVAQIILRWHLQHDVIVIPKSTTSHRIEENISVFDFELSTEHMEEINALNEHRRLGRNPECIDF